MDNVVGSLITVLLQGGPEVVAVLILFILLLLFDRRRLLADVARKDTRIDKILDDYHTGNISTAEAINSMKMMLFELKSRVGS